ncbi:MAG: hypothetical protein AAGG01_07960 [Planctomycetota bacterium]
MNDQADGGAGGSTARREDSSEHRIWRSIWFAGRAGRAHARRDPTERSLRILHVALDGRARDYALDFEAALEADPELRALAQMGGPAVPLTASVLAARGRGGVEAPAIAISVGAAVVRGVTTAARASLSARTRLREGLVEASFGGGFARAFCASTDVLLIWGSRDAGGGGSEDAGCCGWVIELDADGNAALRQAPFERTTPADRRAALLLESGGCALVAGPGADAGVPFAHLGSWTSGTASPSLVGRGGVGHAMRGAGIAAVCVAESSGEAPTDTDSEDESALLHALRSSPRLIARASGGTLELGDARLSTEGGRATVLGDRSPSTRHGCVGCPTPCGWQFKTGREGAEVVGRFAALQAFLESALTRAFGAATDALELVAECNRLGIDARSAARFFQLEDVIELLDGRTALEALRSLVTPGTALHSRARRYGAADDAEPAAPSHPADLVAVIGQRLSARGPEPLRSLSVLGLEAAATEGSDVRADLATRLGIVGLGDDVEKNAGALAHWHECLAAAIDLFGFCAFSGAGLIADRILDIDSLGNALEPGLSGRELLALGSKMVALHRELWSEEHWDVRAATISGAALQGHELARAASVSEVRVCGSERETRRQASSRVARVEVLATGWLAQRLAKEIDHVELEDRAGIRMTVDVTARRAGPEDERDAACTVQRVIEALAATAPAAGRLLISEGGRVLPAVLITGRPAGPDTPVKEGEPIEVLLVIPGG